LKIEKVVLIHFNEPNGLKYNGLLPHFKI
jgi:hypothetical protein